MIHDIYEDGDDEHTCYFAFRLHVRQRAFYAATVVYCAAPRMKDCISCFAQVVRCKNCLTFGLKIETIEAEISRGSMYQSELVPMPCDRNAEVGSQVRIAGLSSDAGRHLNGRVGIVEGAGSSQDRVGVRVDGKLISIKHTQDVYRRCFGSLHIATSALS